jgi:hypothetical protein
VVWVRKIRPRRQVDLESLQRLSVIIVALLVTIRQVVKSL